MTDLLFLRTSLLGFIKDRFSWNFGGDASKTLDSSAKLSSRAPANNLLQSPSTNSKTGLSFGQAERWWSPGCLKWVAETCQDAGWYNVYCFEIVPFPSISHHIFPYLSIILLCILPLSSTSLSCNIFACLAISYRISSCLSSFHILPHFTIPYRRYRILPYLIIPDRLLPICSHILSTIFCQVFAYLTVSYHIGPNLTICFHTLHCMSFHVFSYFLYLAISSPVHILQHLTLSCCRPSLTKTFFRSLVTACDVHTFFADHLRRKVL